MPGEFIEFFNELMYGSGAWIGLILILGLSLLIVAKVKYSSAPFAIIFLFLGIFYLDNVAADSNFIWSALIMWFMIPFLAFIEFKRPSS